MAAIVKLEQAMAAIVKLEQAMAPKKLLERHACIQQTQYKVIASFLQGMCSHFVKGGRALSLLIDNIACSTEGPLCRDRSSQNRQILLSKNI